MGVIKEAFVEGRETDVSWKDSKAKKNADKLDVFAHNVDNFNGREFRKKIALEQVDLETGKVIRSFTSRLAAARWVCENVLHTPADRIDIKAQSITGNMHMSMTNGWQSYGFLWRYIDVKQHNASVLSKAKSKGGRAVWTNLKGAGQVIYASIAEASKALSIPATTLRDALNANEWARVNGILVSEYNPVLKEIEFKTVTKAIEFFGGGHDTMVNAADAGVLFNNYKIIIKNRVEPKQVTVYRVIGKRGKLIEEFTSKRAIETKYKVKSKALANAIADKTPFLGILRCVVHTKTIGAAIKDKK